MRKGNFIFHLINAAIFVALEIAALGMLRSNGPLQDTWMAKGSQAFMGSVWGLTQRVGDYFSLKESNDSLALENFRLRARIAGLEEYIGDSLRVSSIGKESTSKGFRYIPASISKISGNSQHNYIIIGKGETDGVEKGDGVVTGNGAIGVIDAVSEHFSYARSFQNHGMSISARLGRTGTSGQLVWDGIRSNGAFLNEIPHHVEISVGDTIYTSGFSSIFPPDIPLGVTGKSRVVNGSTYEIQIRLFEDFTALRYVTVVKNLSRNEIKQLEGRR